MAAETNRLSAHEVLVEHRTATGRWWVVPLLIPGVLLVLAVLAMVAVAVRMRQAHYAAVEKVNREVVRLEAQGEPVTTEALYAFHVVPPTERDITHFWLDVVRSYNEKQFNLDGTGLPIVGEGDRAKLLPTAEDSQLAAAEAFLVKYDATLQAALAAAREEGQCRFPMEFEKGVAMLLEHVQKMRGVQRLLALRVRTRAVQGDIDGALEALQAMYAAAQTLQQEMCLVEHLVRLALVGSALEETEWLQEQKQLNEAQLAKLQQRVTAIDAKSGLTTGVIGERAIVYHTFHHLGPASKDLFGGASPLPLTFGAVDGKLARPVDCLKSLELLGEVVEASREPFPEARRKADAVNSKLIKLAGTRNPLERMQYMVTLLMLPATQSAFDATARGLAQREVVLTAIAARRYRLKHGSFPAQLSDLVPDFLDATPLDPFTGRPLKLIQAGGDLVIYSVGKDGIDNGGQGALLPQQRDPDIVVRVK